MKKRTTVLLVGLLCGSCGLLDILGPRDKPDFQSKEWSEISITYWLSTTSNEEKRTFTVTNSIIMADLKDRMRIKTTSGISIGADDQLVLTERNGVQWQGNIVFPDTVHLCKRLDKWYSYRIDFSDTSLFDAILSLCVTNERTFHPFVVTENIKLQRNLGVEYPPVKE